MLGLSVFALLVKSCLAFIAMSKLKREKTPLIGPLAPLIATSKLKLFLILANLL